MRKIVIALVALCFTACATAPTSAGKKASEEPAWFSNPSAVYPDNQYVSAVGYGKDREDAGKNALGALVSVFGQSVKGSTTVSSRYSQAVKNGILTDSSEDSAIDRSVDTSYDFDTLIGAEVKDVWYNQRDNTTYAVAVLDKLKALQVYSDLIDKNEKTITRLIAVPEAELYTFDAYARYDLAATIADSNETFLNLLSVISPATASMKRTEASTGDKFRLECVKIAQEIPVDVVVSGDSEGRIQSAFSSVFTEVGFKTGDTGSRYQLDVTVSLSDVKLPKNQNKFTRYVVDAKLTDTTTSMVIFPYSVNGREGHATQEEANNRAIRTAEKKIEDDYKDQFEDFLSQLIIE